MTNEKTPINTDYFISATALMLDKVVKEKDHYQHKSIELEKKSVELEKKSIELEKELNWLKEQINLRKQNQFNGSSEKLNHLLQEQLFDETELSLLNPPKPESEQPEEKVEVSYSRSKENKKRDRYIDTSSLPRERHVMDLSDAEKICGCGCELKKIGEDVREEIQSVLVRHKVIEHVRPKYACLQCNQIKSAPALMLPIPKSKASSSFLAEIITNKYLYHLPLYRQAKIFNLTGLKISDSTLGYLVMTSAKLLEKLGLALWQQLPLIKRLQVDETPVKIIKPEKKGFVWVYHSYSAENRFVIFDFAMGREQTHVDQRLANFKGLLQTDGYSGYNNQRKRADIISIGCFDHCRRYFADVVKVAGHNKSGKAGQVLKLIAKLYEIEEEIKDYSYEERYRIRQEKAKPKLKHLFAFLEKIQAPPKTLLHKAVAYALNQKSFLMAYIEHGDAQISNCWTENLIRPFAVGRRNWLFMGNEISAKRACLLYSLIETCLLNNIEPRLYLQYVLNQAHRLRRNEVDPVNLLPQFIDRALLLNQKAGIE